jgi:dethiobiotin synthetase
LPGTGYFITGTDTGIGKTLVACALLRAFSRQGLRAVGMKPVASGCTSNTQDDRNEDVAALLSASNVCMPVDLVNPFCFGPAIAPHIAARQTGAAISLARIRDCYSSIADKADRIVVEGAGGLLVPLNEREDFGDLVQELGLSVVLVVGMRLGCLNHAFLTAEAIHNRGLHFAGWVANRLDPALSFFDENVQTLRERLPAPLIATMPFAPDAVQACTAMNPGLLMGRRS